MRVRVPSLALMSLVCTAGLYCQQAGTPRSLLADSLTAMNGTTTNSISLSGAAEYIAGSIDERGSFTAQCASNASSQLTTQIPSFSHTEMRATTGSVPNGSWRDEDGKTHGMAGQNIMTPAAWFCPSMLIAHVLLDPTLDVKYVGKEMHNGQPVDHIYVISRPVDHTRAQQRMTGFSRTEIYLDPSTLRPTAIEFKLHPDGNALVDIPTEIRFGDYIDTSGAWLPSTIEKYMNSTLMLKLNVDSFTPSMQVPQN